MTGAAPRRRARLLRSAGIVGSMVVVAIVLAAGVAAAQSPPFAASASPTSGLSDGSVVRVHVELSGGAQLYELRAHVCRPGTVVTNAYDFSATGNMCPVVALSPSSEAEGYQSFGPGSRSGDLDVYVGVGSVRWQDLDGAVTTMACGRDLPCQLVVQLQITDDTQFWSTPLTFASSEQRSPPTPPPGRPDQGGGRVGGMLALDGPSIPVPTTEPIVLSAPHPAPDATTSVPEQASVPRPSTAPSSSAIVASPGTTARVDELAAGPSGGTDGGGSASAASLVVPVALVIALVASAAVVIRRARRS